MVVKQLSLNYLSDHIGVENFRLVKSSYDKIVEDGHFEKKISDKDLASQLFNSTIHSDFFDKRDNLHRFVFALPPLTQEKILNDLNLSSVKDLTWNQGISKYFINILGLDPKFAKGKLQENKSVEYFQLFENPASTFKKLKEYQTDVFFKTYNYISETPFARCIIQMPTGSGKTRTAMEIVCEIINQTKKDVLWLANTEELCDQAYFSFIEVWKYLKRNSAGAVNHLRYKDPLPSSRNYPIFHVASLQSFNSGDKHKKLGEYGIHLGDLELLIVDEAHVSIAPTYKDTISKISTAGTKLIGLTATPGRQLKKLGSEDENQKLSEFYFYKKFELNTGKERPIEYLRKKGILSNARFVSIEGTNLEKVLTKSEISSSIKNNKIPKKIEEILTNDSSRTAIIFDQLISLLKKDKKILFFGTSLNHSKLISALLNLKGFKAAHVDGATGKYRSKIIQDFKENKLQILCNYGVLSTGFDDPKIDVVFMARPTNSLVLYSQIIGRGLRGPEIGGTDTTEVYTVFDNLLDLPSNNEIYSYFDEYFLNTDYE